MTTTNLAEPRDIGVPVKGLSWVRLHPGRRADGSPLLLATMGQDHGTLFVCDIELRTGHCRQYHANIPSADHPTSTYMEPATGVLYVGSSYSGHLHRYDPNRPESERELEDLGAIDPQLASFPCRIDQAPDGRLYIGAFPGCSMTRFDPATGQFERFGRMDETDMYLYPLCGSDGSVAALVRMCRLHVVVLDPATGKHREVGPSFDANAMNIAGQSAEHINLIRGVDGLLYITSSQGTFRVRGMDIEPVDVAPEAELPRNTLPDGTTVKLIDAGAFTHRQVELHAPDGATREITLDWEGGGTHLFVHALGPDGRIYGSSMLPEHLYRYDPRSGEMVDLGQCSVSGGEAYSLDSLDGKLYIASYPAARLSIYDPKLPYRFGTDEGSNPRDVGSPDDGISYRPRAMVAGPAGKVWIGSIPNYGLWGGTLASYDPATGRFTSHRHLIQDCSVMTLEWFPERERLLVGLTINAGSGTQPRAERAGFVWWDPHTDRADGVIDFGMDDIEGVLDIKRAGENRAYVVVVRQQPEPEPSEHPLTAELLLINVATGEVVDRSAFSSLTGWPLEIGLRDGPGGAVFGCTHPYIYRVTPGTAQREVIWSNPFENDADHIQAAGPIIDHTFYFSSKHRLRAIEIPQSMR